MSPALSTALDINEVRAWLNHCVNFHTDHCGQTAQSKQIFNYLPKWLIDVDRLCLVPATTHEYVALSYVWGARGAALKTRRRNLDRVQQPGAFSLPHGSLVAYPIRDPQSDTDIWRLSSTISSAISFVKSLGECYLWVDSLCIVQDDEEEKQEHLIHMGSIYANAYFTLVSTADTAFAGLRGVEGNPFKRVRRPAEYARYPSSLHRELRRQHHKLHASPWASRGWTFQEQIFSRRLLIFSEEGVTWECHCAVWFEGMPLEKEDCKASIDMVAQGFYVGTTPQFADYTKHVTEYNRRDLTYPEDGLDAISGVLGVLSAVFEGGFIAGLPVKFFDEALLWRNKAPLRRRRAKLDRGREKVAPSWSWAAWAGDIEFTDLAGEARNLKPLVQWECATRADGKWQTLPAIGAGQPVDGIAVAHAMSDESVKPSEYLADARAESHLNVPSPMPTFTSTSPSHLLRCRADRAFFKATFQAPTAIILESSSGAKVGTLDLCEAITTPRPHLNTFSQIEPEEAAQSICEVIAISESKYEGSGVYNVLHGSSTM